MSLNVSTIKTALNLIPHPEGGYFKETQRSSQLISTPQGQRALYTSILFLLTANNPSHLHRLKSDETWYYHLGAALDVHCLFPDGSYQLIKIGPDIQHGQQLSYTVPKNTIFGSSVTQGFSLVSCVVAPGYDDRDFELFTQQELIKQYPKHATLIKKMAYEQLDS